jgi:hypothetical protein
MVASQVAPGTPRSAPGRPRGGVDLDHALSDPAPHDRRMRLRGHLDPKAVTGWLRRPGLAWPTDVVRTGLTEMPFIASAPVSGRAFPG